MKQANACLPPDSLTGAIMAMEGIRDAAVLLNGPTGCKFYHGAIVEGQLPRESSFDPLQFLEEFYFGQPRVPATYLDGDDYVFGASAKLERILPTVAAKGHSLIAVVNSPGAALIGDDLNRFIQAANLDIPCVAVESTGYSGTMEEGFQEAVIQTLRTLKPQQKKSLERTVNLLGISIFQKHWEGNIAELTRLLALCGVNVGAVVCAGSSFEEIMAMGNSQCNVMVHEELGGRIAEWCESRLGLPTMRPINGAPIGFDRTEEWVRGVCRAVGVSPQPAIEAIDQARIRGVTYIQRLNSLTGLPKGATFAVRAPVSIALPLTQWLHDYLGMAPAAVDLTDADSPLMPEMKEVLNRAGALDALGVTDFSGVDMVFADGASLAQIPNPEGMMTGVEIALPTMGYIDVVHKCLLGAQGTLHLIEWIVNALRDC
ncbi:nitrogenase component 1 [Desulfatibacillum aliphaticivorans]|uniref:nitrogenase component 1 n=1 Tax=Desulfatibacillum aliphaticivorans TaxID=218208 RepID=UPI00040BD985|nr:nitrogenase component 1 [Desulfatibacillum aliphaticivorans]